MKRHETFNTQQELKERIDLLKKKNFGELDYEIINTLEERQFILVYEIQEELKDLDIEDGLIDQNKNEHLQNDRPAGYSTEFISENGINRKD